MPNPFLNNPNVPRSLSTPATLSRARLLRPFPQYGQINARQVTEGLSRYHAVVVEVTKRMSKGLGGRFSYTYSQLKDNQVGESNFYAAVSPGIPMNNYNYIPTMPACTAGQQFTTACYDPLSEYGLSMLDVPHRVLLAPIAELPFGAGKRWANGRTADLLIGGWTVAAAITLQSGFPINVQQAADSRLGGANANRPNLTGADLATSGSFADRLASADHASATWLNPAAFSLAPAGTFGNAPRAITDVRGPGWYVVDASFIKNIRFGSTQGRPVQARGAEHPEPSERAHASGREHIRKREFRPDDDPGWLLANLAADVPLELLDQETVSAESTEWRDRLLSAVQQRQFMREGLEAHEVREGSFLKALSFVSFESSRSS